MKVISTVYLEKKNAAPKAPKDIDTILNKEYGAKIISIKRTKYFKYKVLINFILNKWTKDTLVLQYPLVLKPSLYNILPKQHSIILIHDIIGLRNNNDEILSKEIEIFNKFNYIVVHNKKMQDFLVTKGIVPDKIYTLQLFDYLANEEKKDSKTENVNLENAKILYPGNLKKEKSPFIYQMDDKKMNYTLELYGIGIDKDINEKIKYNGSFEPENLGDLKGDLGLVWDGNLDESDENGSFKEYTKFNNPHKLSCCLAVGVPVIVWEKAAIAEFVKNNNIGYTIKNLYDINNLNYDDYKVKKRSVQELGKKVKEGFFTKKVFNKILSDFERNGKKFE